MHMNWRNSGAVVAACAALIGCGSTPTAQHAEDVHIPHLITADIQAGIEKHIAEQTEKGGGYYVLPYKDGHLRLKLVRVHTEYLANLGPRYHFACVDLATSEGDVYDVDFFLKGDPGAMTVTETTVHKINGQPFYVWEQKADKTWERVSYDGAAPPLLGVLTGSDTFEFIYRATLPPMDEPAQMWIPLPSSDDFQKIELISIAGPGKQQRLRDEKFGNEVLYLTLDPADSGRSVVLRFQVQRREKSAYPGHPAAAIESLLPERLVPSNPQFRNVAAQVVEGKDGALMRARALYDHVIEEMKYAKFGKGWGRGDAVFACDSLRGNCTDYHAYFIALARSVDIPARFAIGAAIPSSRNEGGITGYHCWAEFYADGRWWPIDISEADKCSSLTSYYFGRHPANRIELSRGRDLVVTPGPKSGPINFLAYPVLEVGGKPAKAKVRFAFVREAGEKLN